MDNPYGPRKNTANTALIWQVGQITVGRGCASRHPDSYIGDHLPSGEVEAVIKRFVQGQGT
jgi:hypothetical protein